MAFKFIVGFIIVSIGSLGFVFSISGLDIGYFLFGIWIGFISFAAIKDF